MHKARKNIELTSYDAALSDDRTMITDGVWYAEDVIEAEWSATLVA